MWKDKYTLLQQIAGKHQTPIYIYDSSIINSKVQELKKYFANIPYQIHYAMKANENEEILKIFLHQKIGVDTVSVNEINRALKIGFKPQQIVYTPSCPTEAEIDFAFQNNIPIHIGAIEYFDYILKNYPDKPIGLRINPANSIGGNQKISTAHANSKFGIPLNKLEAVLSYVNKGLTINALHIHTGSDVKTWKDLARSVDTIFEVAAQFNDLEYIDLGSGFKVKYEVDDNEIDLQSYAKHIEEKIHNFPYSIQIKFEPGKFLVSESGVFLTKVNIVKQGYSKQFIGVNSGFHQLIRPMYYDAYHEIINISNPSDEKHLYDVVGQLCEEDTFAYNRKISKVTKGDLLLFKNVGAYGFSMAMQYNLRTLPKQVLLNSDNSFRLV